ncbi:MAG: M28 family peptidase [Bacteroidota bacterium]
MKFQKSVLILLFTTFFQFGLAQGTAEQISALVDQSFIKSHIGFLASDELKGRDTGSPELAIAARYITSRFTEYGVKTHENMDSFYQEVPMEVSKPLRDGTIQLGEKQFMINSDFLKLKGNAETLAAEILYVEKEDFADLKGGKVEGKVVVTLCGKGDSESPQQWFREGEEKRQSIAKLGGLALIELYASPQIPWKSLVGYLSRERVRLEQVEEEEQNVPHIWMNRNAVDLSLIEKKATASIKIPVVPKERFTSNNIVGYVEGTDPKLKDEIVVYSAHYDHIGIGSPDAKGDSIYNGARDNAVGVVTVLAAAKYLGANPTRRSALFVLFTGEEKGLLGSKYFVENSPLPLKEMVFCFNSDNGGYNDTSLASIIGLTRTSAEKVIVDACKQFGLKAIEDPAKEQGLFDRSDNVNFAVKGIPAPTFSMGFTSFDEDIQKYYHQAADSPETLDYEYLEKFFRAYVLSCVKIGNLDEPPFWVEGDKYYTAGKVLYSQ